MKKSVVAVMLTIAMLVETTSPVIAASRGVSKGENIELSAWEGSVEPNSSDRDYVYKTVVAETKMKDVSGFAGGQNNGPTKFRTGGGFYYTEEGGPSASASVTFGSTKVPISVTLGVASAGSTVGRFVEAPNTTDYFRLYVVKHVKVEKIVTYRKKKKDTKWEEYSTTYYREVLGTEPYAKKVKM